MVPVWFFIGMLLLRNLSYSYVNESRSLFYGLVTLVTVIREYNHPRQVVLAQYHASVLGGMVLILIGSLFSIRLFPRRSQFRVRESPTAQVSRFDPAVFRIAQ